MADILSQSGNEKTRYDINQRIQILRIAFGCGRKDCEDFKNNSGKSYRDAAKIFAEKYPEVCPQPTQSTVMRWVKNFMTTGSVHDLPRVGRKKTATTNENTSEVLIAINANGMISTRRISLENRISQSAVIRILRANKYHPFKIHPIHKLEEYHLEKRIDFCSWAIDQVELIGRLDYVIA